MVPTAAAIATLVITKAFEKVGEQIGTKVIEAGSKLLSLLKCKKPDTAIVVEQAQQEPSNYGETVIEQLEAAAKDDAEIQRAIQELETAAKEDSSCLQALEAIEKAISSQSSTVHNYGKIAESLPNLKAVFQGNIIQGDVNF